MKARISNLNKTEDEWLKLPSFTPEAGELIIYDPDDKIKYSRVKVGDGVRTLQELDFFVKSTTEDILYDHRYDEVVDGGRITGLPD